MEPGPLEFFGGLGLLVFLSCAGAALWRWAKHKFPLSTDSF